MRNRQTGFTMIELIVVIVILGILAATALPKFLDLRSDALSAATKGMAGAMSSASSLNYAGCSATNNNTAGANAAKCTTVETCAGVFTLIQGGQPAGYTGAVKAPSTESDVNGTSFTCTLTYIDPSNSNNTATADYTAIAAGN